MESQAKYALVGGVVILLTGLIIFAVIWLSEAGGLRRAKYFSIDFKEHSLYGLQKDAYVTMRGVKVGSVQNIRISEKNIELVRVTIAVDKAAPVRTDTVALINRNLLTGFLSIDLSRGTQGAGDLVDIPPDEIYPMIPEARSPLEQVTDSIPEVIEKISVMTARVDRVLSDKNVDAVSDILQNSAAVVKAVSDQKQDLASLFKKVETAADKLAKLADSSDKAVVSIGDKLNSVGDETVKIMGEARAAASELREQTAAVGSAVQASSQIIAQSLVTLSRDISTFVKSFEAITPELTHPRRILTGPHKGELGPGEVR